MCVICQAAIQVVSTVLESAFLKVKKVFLLLWSLWFLLLWSLFCSENVIQLIGLLQMQNDLILLLILGLKLDTPADGPNCQGVCFSHKLLMCS